MTGPAFLNLLSTIIKHGDLTDIAFAEKTLRTKFSVEPAKTYNREPDPLGMHDPNPPRIFFQTNQVFGSQIYVDLSLSRLKTRPPKYQSIGRMVIYDQHYAGINTTFMEDCLNISYRAFSSYFRGDFLNIQDADNPSPYSISCRQQGFQGKNNTILKLSISTDDRSFDYPIAAAEILQVSQKIVSGN